MDGCLIVTLAIHTFNASRTANPLSPQFLSLRYKHFKVFNSSECLWLYFGPALHLCYVGWAPAKSVTLCQLGKWSHSRGKVLLPITETNLTELPSSIQASSSDLAAVMVGNIATQAGPCFAVHCTTCQPQYGVKSELKGQSEEARHVSHSCKDLSVRCFILLLWCKWLHFFSVKMSCKNKREGILLWFCGLLFVPFFLLLLHISKGIEAWLVLPDFLTSLGPRQAGQDSRNQEQHSGAQFLHSSKDAYTF